MTFADRLLARICLWSFLKDVVICRFAKRKADEIKYLYDPEMNQWAQKFIKETQHLFTPSKVITSPLAKMFYAKRKFGKLFVPYQRLITLFEDGEKCILDVLYGDRNPEIIMFVCHGLGGDSSSFYIKKLALTAAEKYGITVVVYNRRGHTVDNNSTVKPWPLHYDIQDMDTAISFVKKHFPNYKKMVGVGFSMGSNMLVKYCGETTELGRNSFHSIVSVCNGWDFNNGVDALTKTANALTYPFMSDIIRFHPHLRTHPRVVDMLHRGQSFKELDSLVTKLAYGEDFDINHYYDSLSSLDLIQHITVPILAITASDDPFVKNTQDKNIQHAMMKNPVNFCSISSLYGGHIGWHDDWVYDLISSFAKFDTHKD